MQILQYVQPKINNYFKFSGEKYLYKLNHEIKKKKKKNLIMQVNLSKTTVQRLIKQASSQNFHYTHSHIRDMAYTYI